MCFPLLCPSPFCRCARSDGEQIFHHNALWDEKWCCINRRNCLLLSAGPAGFLMHVLARLAGLMRGSELELNIKVYSYNYTHSPICIATVRRARPSLVRPADTSTVHLAYACQCVRVRVRSSTSHVKKSGSFKLTVFFDWEWEWEASFLRERFGVDDWCVMSEINANLCTDTQYRVS